jgi:hypothetical protein
MVVGFLRELELPHSKDVTDEAEGAEIGDIGRHSEFVVSKWEGRSENLQKCVDAG